MSKKTIIKLSFTIAFLYVFIGTFDNLNGLKIEDSLNNFFCNKGPNPLCELIITIFYGLSYLPGRMLSAFFNSNDGVFIIMQFMMFTIYSIITFSALIFLQIIYNKFSKKSNK